MKRLKLVGGPSAYTVRLIDPDTGENIPATAIRVSLDMSERSPVLRATVDMIVECDLDLDVDNLSVGEVLNLRTVRVPA